MKDAESKIKEKRTRHCYPRLELYHRWIHSPQYVYSTDKSLFGKFNCLAVSDIRKYNDEYAIKSNWYNIAYSSVAIIDRNKKKICIFRDYKYYTDLLYSLPKDYEIFWCKNDIPCYNIFDESQEEILYKTHLECVIELYIKDYLINFYNCIDGARTLHDNIDDIEKYTRITYSKSSFNEIKDFVNKYKIKRYSWYNKSLNNKFTFRTYYPNTYDTKTISLPSVKQIITNTVFNNKEKEYLRKKYFYTKYCYGRGISFKDVEKYWNKTIKYDTTFNPNVTYDLEYKDIERFLKSKHIYWLYCKVDDTLVTWNDYVIKTKTIDEHLIEKRIKDNFEKSKQNEEKATKQLLNNIHKDTIKNWRETGRFDNFRTTYKRFISPNKNHKHGRWINQLITLNSKLIFKNVQLRLQGTDVIETSRNCTVRIDDAIKCFNLYKLCQKTYNKNYDENNKEKDYIRSFVKDNIKINIYNLIEISYKDKYTDLNEPLGYKSWLIKIGCHNIWLDDFIDFVHYYHLENKFDINF